ncbi:neurocan core protein [Polyodon spathula]|uniref:neurocan core protein n=1 Tax=Polyodon spathula TaxID=7913 RepID=UPI001B7E4DBD|nr:neurocan core protein [Polyodon spathula]
MTGDKKKKKRLARSNLLAKKIIIKDGGTMLNLCLSLSVSVLCGTPPAVENAFLIGRKRAHYDIHSVVRYQCADGFLQRHVPTTKCRSNGKWDRPKIICTKSRRAHRSRRHHHKSRRERRKHKKHSSRGHREEDNDDSRNYF